MPLWKQRRQGQSTEGQKLKFSLLFGLRFTTVMEFLTSHWCLVLSCPGSLKENVQVVTCLLMLTSYQNSAEHPVTFPGAMVFLEKKHYHCPRAPWAQSTQIPLPCLCIILACSENRDDISFSPLLCVPCLWLVSSFEQELFALTCVRRLYHNQDSFQLRHLLDVIVT